MEDRNREVVERRKRVKREGYAHKEKRKKIKGRAVARKLLPTLVWVCGSSKNNAPTRTYTTTRVCKPASTALVHGGKDDKDKKSAKEREKGACKSTD